MIISKTPLRISFLGGGSDIPSLIKGFDGNVISTTIDKYIYTIFNNKYDDNIRISYSKTENVNKVDKIKNELIKQVLKKNSIDKGIEIITVADIPTSGSGLGSSSALIVGMLNCIYSKKKFKINKYKLAYDAFEIETKLLKKKIGLQDPFISSFGGFNHLKFKRSKTFIKPIKISNKNKNKLKNHLLLFYTGITRNAEKILNNIDIENNKKNVKELSKLAVKFKIYLENEKISELGKIIHDGWNIKKKLDKNVTTKFITQNYNIAIESGADGGKILGAGGGGYFLFFAKPKKHPEIIKNLSHLQLIDFNFENNGSKIIYND